MTTLFSSAQLTKLIMANYQFRSLYSLLMIFSLLIQYPILTVAQQNQDGLTSTTILRSTTTLSAVSYNDDSVYEGGVGNSEEDIYDDESNAKGNPHQTIISPGKLNNKTNEYDDEVSSYPDDEDASDNSLYANTMSVDRPDSKQPIVDSNNKKTSISQPPLRIPFISTNLGHDLFAKPAILVGVVGGIVIGMMSAILLIMFIIYRMRKKDEGSYALEEGPRKSPCHAYTRVSSREFFA